MSDMTLVECALDKLSNGKLGPEQRQYIAALIDDSVIQEPDDCLSLLESILLAGNVIADRNDGLDFCSKLLSAIKSGNLDDLDSSAQLLGARLDRPTRLADLVRTIFNRGDAADESAPVRSSGYEDPFLGLEKSSGNFNAVMPIEESMQLVKAAAKKREKQIRLMKEWEKSKVPLPPPKRRHGDTAISHLTDISVHRFSVAVAGRELLKDAVLKIALGRKYGLVGRNGIGKTTFLSALVRHDIPGVDPSINIGCVEQDLDAYLDYKPLECVLMCDEERDSLLREEQRLLNAQHSTDDDAVGKRLTWVYSRLADIEADKAEAQAASILSGLGLSEEMYRVKKLRELSGGWRVRVMLAKLLFADPDILCLDEPTNHLDIHAVSWLTKFLSGSAKTCIIVSHARSFLNEVCTDTLEFKDRQLKYYSGNYDVFERSKAERELHLRKEIENQEAQRAHMQKFIDKFRYNAKRASLAQSRLKAIAKLPLLEKITEDPTLQFMFTAPTDLPTPMLVMQNVSFAWDAKSVESKQYLLQGVDFTADLSTRAAICGVNGSGKSTFLKLLLGEEQPSEGFVFRHNKLKIGYFAQHHIDGLDLTKNAVQQLQDRYPHAKLSDEAARSFLGRFGIAGIMALEPLFILSGGQKSRVAIAVMAFDDPHILVLDEPTNHLDLDAVQALIAAFNAFEGGLIVVSHDSHLLSCCVEDVYHVSPTAHTLIKLKCDFDEYRQMVLKSKI